MSTKPRTREHFPRMKVRRKPGVVKVWITTDLTAYMRAIDSFTKAMAEVAAVSTRTKEIMDQMRTESIPKGEA